MKRENQLSYFLENLEIQHESKNKKEMWAIFQKWRESFSENLKLNLDKWQIEGVDWHTFSYGYFPYLKAARAEARYREIITEEYFLFVASKNNEELGYFCRSESLPNLEKLHDLLERTDLYDLYIFSKDYDWTFVFTHEEDFSIIFAEIKK